MTTQEKLDETRRELERVRAATERMLDAVYTRHPHLDERDVKHNRHE